MFKKGLLSSALLIILLLAFGVKRNASVDAVRTISENDEVKKEVAQRLGIEESVEEHEVIEDVSGNEGSTVSENHSTANRADDFSQEELEEGCLYVIPAKGNQLGSVSIVSGNALVLLPPDGTVLQGDYDDCVIDGHVVNWAFYQNQTLTSYDIPDYVESIGNFAFARCGLHKIIIPEGVQSIGYAAFYHCDSLREVLIPSTVKEIQAHAFEYTPWYQDFMQNGEEDFLIVGDGILLAYRGSETRIQIPKEVKVIAEGALPQDITIIQ